jgi:hypothetical protein
MFDTIVCRYPIDGVEEEICEQTKDYSCTMSSVIIEKDGTLVRDYGYYDPNFEPSAEEFTEAARLDRPDSGLKWLELLRQRKWVSIYKRVDFTGSLFVGGALFYFDRGLLSTPPARTVYTDPFTAPAVDPT